jgi:hypothetical protein
MNSTKVGRNDPCPCGSGHKFKRCCEGKATNSTSSSTATPALTGGKFRFEPGSYGDKGMFAASVSCLKEVRPDEWVYNFVLANPHASFVEEQAAVDAATRHLEGAFAQKQRTGSDITLAAYLKDQGYVSVEGFKVIDDPPGGQKQ